MRFVTRIIATSRAVRLGHEFHEIEHMIRKLQRPALQKLALLTVRELAQAGRCEFPHLYGTPPERRYAMWGSGTHTGLARAHSDNLQVRLRGIALWLAVTYHETRDSEHAQLNALHRQVLGLVRQLKQSVPEHRAAGTARRVAKAVA